MGVLLIASNLPAAGAGKTYEMWVIPKGGAPQPAGLFQSEGTRGLHILSGPIDVSAIGTVAVTIEPVAGSVTPTMPIIIAAPDWDLKINAVGTDCVVNPDGAQSYLLGQNCRRMLNCNCRLLFTSTDWVPFADVT